MFLPCCWAQPTLAELIQLCPQAPPLPCSTHQLPHRSRVVMASAAASIDEQMQQAPLPVVPSHWEEQMRTAPMGKRRTLQR